MSQIVTIGGSPSHAAKSSAVLDHVHQLLRRRSQRVSSILVRNLPPDDLMFARLHSPAIQAAHFALEQAEGVIIATPVYKAAYSGVLKTFLDLLPQNVLQGKTVLPVAIGGASSQLLALDYALKPVLSALGAQRILRGVYFADAQIQLEHGGALRLDDLAEQQLRAALDEFVADIQQPAAPCSFLPAVSALVKNGASHLALSSTLLECFER